MNTIVGFDLGAGALKVACMGKTALVPSAVSVDDGTRLYAGAGQESKRRPMSIQTADGQFYIGTAAHDFGEPIENLDFDRLIGTPELRALAYGALTVLQSSVEETRTDVTLVIGLPNAVLKRADKADTVRQVKACLSGAHEWKANHKLFGVTVSEVLVTGQPVGALSEFFLGADGQARPEHARHYTKDVGVVNIGASTVDLLVSNTGHALERFTHGEALGARTIMHGDGVYSFAELDAQARAGDLDLSGQRDVWASKVMGYIDEKWGRAYQRFSQVVIAGGGYHILRASLDRKFGVKLYAPSNPVMSTAIGLERIGINYATRKG